MRAFLADVFHELELKYWATACRWVDAREALRGAAGIILILLGIVTLFAGCIVILVTSSF